MRDMRTRSKPVNRIILLALATALVVLTAAGPAGAAGRWLAGDIHTHTWLTDGKNTQGEVVRNALSVYGLDYFANSEHGGKSSYDPSGIPFGTTDPATGKATITPVWRWITLSHYSYPVVQDLRQRYAKRPIIQGVEWNVPTHEHASVGIVGAENEPSGISDFEYRFDEADTDASRSSEHTAAVVSPGIDPATGLPYLIDIPAADFDKRNATARDAVYAVEWLDEKYGLDSYMVVNHPSRKNLWSVADFRAMNDAAPDVAFGMEGLPGHQPDLFGRGGYDNDIGSDGRVVTDRQLADPALTAKARTYGGADFMTSEVGGLWDALLGEGRQFWIFNNSDYHQYEKQFKDASGSYYATQSYDFWPGQYAKTWTFAASATPRGVVNGMREGNVFVTNGDLIDGLRFRVTNAARSATMGQTLKAAGGKTLLVEVAIHSPRMNEDGASPKVHHVDVIAGDVTGPIDPDSPEYASMDTNPSTKVIRTLKTWRSSGGGWKVASFKVTASKDMYLRLRGTNLAPNTKNETDAKGNPLRDELSYVDVPNPDPTKVATKPTIHGNTLELVWNDLWFYSNPVFVDVNAAN
jgi:hypothetical protein